jgi:hypothetical protein
LIKRSLGFQWRPSAVFISVSPKIRRQQVAHADQVVTGKGEQRRVFNLLPTAVFRSPQQADVLAPTAGLLDQLPRLQAQRVSGVTGGASVNRRTATALNVLRYVPRGIDLAQLRDEAGGVILLRVSP